MLRSFGANFDGNKFVRSSSRLNHRPQMHCKKLVSAPQKSKAVAGFWTRFGASAMNRCCIDKRAAASRPRVNVIRAWPSRRTDVILVALTSLKRPLRARSCHGVAKSCFIFIESQLSARTHGRRPRCRGATRGID